MAAMLPLVLDAWIPGGLLTANATNVWGIVVTVVGIVMMGYAAMALWLVWHWMLEARDENYSNPDDFPLDFARRVRLMPIVLTLMLWPAYLLDSPEVMAVMNVLLAAFNVVLLLNVLPSWRRLSVVAEVIELSEDQSEETDELVEERSRKIAEEIEAFVRDGKGYLDAHLKIGQVAEHCSYSRTYVSKVFQDRFDGFYNYVNRLRLEHYDRYMAEHPNATMDTAAQDSGFTSYNAYYKVKERLESQKK